MTYDNPITTDRNSAAGGPPAYHKIVYTYKTDSELRDASKAELIATIRAPEAKIATRSTGDGRPTSQSQCQEPASRAKPGTTGGQLPPGSTAVKMKLGPFTLVRLPSRAAPAEKLDKAAKQAFEDMRLGRLREDLRQAVHDSLEVRSSS
jgi:hypothetical protein